MLEKITYNPENIKISIFVFILWITLFFYINKKLRPSFVIPEKYKNRFLERTYKIINIIIILILTILPLNPQYIIWKQIKIEKTLNIQFLFDVSLSMTATDIKPYRFKAAKDTIIKILKDLPWYDISIIFFSWIPLIRVPFSNENLAIINKIQNTTMADFPPTINFVWTAIWDAILLWIDNLLKFAKNKTKPWIIVLITDWDSNKWYDPVDAAKYAANLNIPIYVLAIGKSNYLVWKDIWWRNVFTKIDTKLLKKIADISWWKFYRILKAEDFQNFIDDLKKLTKSEEIKKVYYKKINLNKYLYLILILFLIINIMFKILILNNINQNLKWK